MTNQNYINAFLNANKNITIACSEPNDNPLEHLNVNYIILSKEDIGTLINILHELHEQIEEEDRNA